MITIKSTVGAVLCQSTAPTIRTALEETIRLGANLTRADLAGADLTPIREDFWAVLSAAPGEVAGLLAAVRDGRIDGTQYTGECSCLKGTLDTLRGTASDYGPLAHDSSSPSEMFFLAISPGETPERNPVAAIVETWITEWQKERA